MSYSPLTARSACTAGYRCMCMYLAATYFRNRRASLTERPAAQSAPQPLAGLDGRILHHRRPAVGLLIEIEARNQLRADARRGQPEEAGVHAGAVLPDPAAAMMPSRSRSQRKP